MAAAETPPTGPDFAEGFPISRLPRAGILAGHVAGEPVMLASVGDQLRAFGRNCTHYGADLAEGLVVGDTLRCPWHHACFSLRTGEAEQAPAIDPLAQWKVEIEGDQVFVREKQEPPARRPLGPSGRKVVLVGGGAAGFAAAEMLRRRGFEGSITLLSADDAPPCDRPNLSKDYLAGTAPEEWIPLKGEDFYRDNAIELRLSTEVASLDMARREAVSAAGERFAFDALLLATGAEPVRLPTPGFDQANVRTLRSLADARGIIALAKDGARAAVIGASFIGLEVAASLRARGVEVHVIAPDAVPMERVLGRELGELVRAEHEAHGVAFHLGTTAQSFAGGRLSLEDGGHVDVDFVVVGVGVRPRLDLAARAGLVTDRGLITDAYLQTNAPEVFAAGDIARYPDPRSGELIRLEHWVVAERQGQTAALNILGERRRFTATPFFWSNHYDLAIRYSGAGAGYDLVRVEGSVPARDATVRFLKHRRLLAAASIGRDLQNLQIAAELQAPLAASA